MHQWQTGGLPRGRSIAHPARDSHVAGSSTGYIGCTRSDLKKRSEYQFAGAGDAELIRNGEQIQPRDTLADSQNAVRG